MDTEIRPLNPGLKLVGIARTAKCRADLLPVLTALQESLEGEVLVIDAGRDKIAMAGEMFANEALRKRLGGIVIDGGIRDSAQIRQTALPVFSRYITPMAGTALSMLNTQADISCGGVPVSPGEIVFGDDDGVVVMTKEEAPEIIRRAKDIQRTEERVFKKLKAGRKLIDMMNYQEHLEKIRNNQ